MRERPPPDLFITDRPNALKYMSLLIYHLVITSMKSAVPKSETCFSASELNTTTYLFISRLYTFLFYNNFSQRKTYIHGRPIQIKHSVGKLRSSEFRPCVFCLSCSR